MKTPLSAAVISLCVMALLVSATGCFIGLSRLSRPENFSNRVLQLDDRLTEIKRLSRSSTLARDYVSGALCRTASAEEVMTITRTLEARAAQLNLSVASLAVSPAETVGETAAKVAFQGEFVGSYDAIAMLLGDMANQTPRIFVERADLTDKATNISFRFSGHFYCSTAA